MKDQKRERGGRGNVRWCCFEDDDDGARVLDESSPSPKSSLWEVIVKWDDVSFKHVLPRLHSNDLKFLHGVNSETRKLIKRSSRAGDLEKRFKLKQMSSISTLEVAWENKSLWAWRWDERSFCWQVALTNKLELLKWAREEKKCEWDAGTINAAARQGNLEMVKYCVANRVSCHCGCLCKCCQKRSSRVPQILTRRSPKRLGDMLSYCLMGG